MRKATRNSSRAKRAGVGRKRAARARGSTRDGIDPPWPAPRDADGLAELLRTRLDLHVPDAVPTAGHDAPMRYLTHTFFEGAASWEQARGAEPARGPFDCLVWANRGGGKTFLGALATMLDLVYKPGIEIRILGGSMDQSRRMHDHLRHLFEREELAAMVEGRITDRRLSLQNGSRVELLAQSQASVRGTRVQKLRCDEVELFHPEVWDAAQLTTRSRSVEVHGVGMVQIRAWVECLSTMHVPHGMMHRLVEQAREGKRLLFRWGVVDVLEQCEKSRRCHGTDAQGAPIESPETSDSGAPVEPPPAASPNGEEPATPVPLTVEGQHADQTRPPHPGDCPLLPECKSRAKDGRGHIPIDDAIAMKMRVSLATWEAEMLCLRPSRATTVLPEFDAKLHVVGDLPRRPEEMTWYAGMDFGITSPTVILWAALDSHGVLWVADEHSSCGQLMSDHVGTLRGAPWPRPTWIAADPAGGAGNSQTPHSDIAFLRRAGFQVRSCRLGVLDGLNLVRARLRPAWTPGGPRLFVLSRCRTLIESLERYHYDPRDPQRAEPVKDGSDHAVDALRYLVLHLDQAFATARGDYL